MFVGACRVGGAYLRVLALAEDRPDRFSDPASARNSRIPSTESAVTTPPTGSAPNMSVAATGIVPGDPSGSNTTKKTPRPDA